MRHTPALLGPLALGMLAACGNSEPSGSTGAPPPSATSATVVAINPAEFTFTPPPGTNIQRQGL